MFKSIVTSYRVKSMFYLLFSPIFVMVAPFTGGAEEMEWLVPPAFEGEELAKVREWEKTWAGKTIDRRNVDQVKEFVPEGVYEVITDASKWGDFDFSFDVLPYKTYKPTPGLVEATYKYSPLAKLTPEESVENYHTMAGVLFPKPKTGLETAWNFYLWTHGDQCIHLKTRGSAIDVRTKLERGSITTHWESYYINRIDKPPVPSFPKNRRKIRRGRFMHMETPPHMTDFCSLEIQYVDLNKQRDGWMYWPRFRRITKIDSATRDDVYDGLDWIQDDYPRAWNEIPQKNHYKLIGRKKLLLSRHTDSSKFERESGMVMLRGAQRELINTYLVEATYKTPGYVYGKQLWFIDPETWVILYKLMYNQKGQLWKYMESLTEMRNIWEGEVCLGASHNVVDLIRRHGSVNITDRNDLETKWEPQKVHSIRNLDRRAY